MIFERDKENQHRGNPKQGQGTTTNETNKISNHIRRRFTTFLPLRLPSPNQLHYPFLPFFLLSPSRKTVFLPFFLPPKSTLPRWKWIPSPTATAPPRIRPPRCRTPPRRPLRRRRRRRSSTNWRSRWSWSTSSSESPSSTTKRRFAPTTASSRRRCPPSSPPSPTPPTDPISPATTPSATSPPLFPGCKGLNERYHSSVSDWILIRIDSLSVQWLWMIEIFTFEFDLYVVSLLGKIQDSIIWCRL